MAGSNSQSALDLERNPGVLGVAPRRERACGRSHTGAPYGIYWSMAPLNVPVLTPVACSKVLSSVKVPVASAKRPVPPVMV